MTPSPSCVSYLMVVVDESLPTAILCSPSAICWAQYGCSHATQDTWPAYTMGMIQFSILNSLKNKKRKTHTAIESNTMRIPAHERRAACARLDRSPVCFCYCNHQLHADSIDALFVLRVG